MRIPSLLMPDPDARSLFSPNSMVVLVGVEPIDGILCHRIEDSTDPTRRKTAWIDSQSLLVRRVFGSTQFTEAFLAKLDADSREVMARAPVGGLITPELKRRIAESEPRVGREFLSEVTTTYDPVVDANIARAEFETDLPAE